VKQRPGSYSCINSEAAVTQVFDACEARNPDKPGFWYLIDLLVRAARRAGRPLSVCGEAISDLRVLPKFLAVGVSCVTVSPRLRPVLRRAVINMEQLKR